MRTYLPPADYDLWFAPLRVQTLNGSRLYLTGPPRVCSWVERRYHDLLDSALVESGHRGLEINFLSGSERPPGPEPASVHRGSPSRGQLCLNPAYSFERFVIGAGNRVAHGAALAVAEAPGEAYNPLFLHGHPGLGKTHLLGAIANYLAMRSPELRVVYTTAERFTSEFIAAINAHEMDRFKDRYRGSDVLLIDDVQFLEGKAKTADELFHTFNSLYESGAQLVLSADRMPAELSALAERLRDRFEWGLIVDLARPDDRTRLTYLRRLLGERDENLDEQAIAAIASRDEHNLRTLQGSLTRVFAVSSLTGSRINSELVDNALAGTRAVSARITASPSIAAITAAVGDRLDVDPESLSSPSRVAPVAGARQLAMYLARQLTDMSLPAIAAAFNRRDHTTVIHALKKVEERLRQDPALGATVTQMVTDLRAGAAG